MRLLFTYIITGILINFLIVNPSSAQRFYSVVFSELPKDMQLYARDDNNLAQVGFSGKIELADWHHLSVVTYRNKVRYGYSKGPIQYSEPSIGNFSVKASIKAEMADYDFEVYACRNSSDSVLIVKRVEIVAGDFYVISGQSNGAANHFGSWSSKYVRTVGRTPDDSPSFGAKDTLWIPSAWSWLYTGAWGIQLQRMILEKYGIPTCVINGSIPGTKISQHIDRNSNNPADPNSLYGNLLYRIQKARPSRIRGFFWYQGEQEAIEGINGYEQQFSQLYSHWQKDYPMVNEFIIMQINVLFNNNSAAGEVRDFQRRSKFLYPKTDHFATMGVPEYDGVHYSASGYAEFGKRMFNFLSGKNYGEAFDVSFSCPDIKKVFYSTQKKDEITLIYDDGQNLNWPSDTIIKGEDGTSVTQSLRNFFFLDGNGTPPAPVQSGLAEGNRIKIKFSQPVSGQKLSYIPPCKPVNVPVFVGPYIINNKGLAAFSFDNVTIGDPITIASFKAEDAGTGSVLLNWDLTSGVTSIILERKAEGEAAFLPLAIIDGKNKSYEDKAVIRNTKYTYRLHGVSDVAESPYVETDILFSPILGNEPASSKGINIFPNPFSGYLNIRLNEKSTGSVEIYNLAGQEIGAVKLIHSDEIFLKTVAFPSGEYFIRFTDTKGTRLVKKIIKK